MGEQSSKWWADRVSNCPDRFTAMDLAQEILDNQYLNKYHIMMVRTFIVALKEKWDI